MYHYKKWTIHKCLWNRLRLLWPLKLSRRWINFFYIACRKKGQIQEDIQPFTRTGKQWCIKVSLTNLSLWSSVQRSEDAMNSRANPPIQIWNSRKVSWRCLGDHENIWRVQPYVLAVFKNYSIIEGKGNCDRQEFDFCPAWHCRDLWNLIER